jgi:uncharacterized protein (TIGR02996 family)
MEAYTMEEEDFIRAIDANPLDDSLRLVYANWLEERGDVRGEFLRLEHQLGQIKARLEALRGQIDPAWLALMGLRFRLVLHRFSPANKIATIKVVREITGLGLKEAKDLVEAAPCTILGDVSFEDGERFRAWFEGVADVTVEPGVETP